MLLNFLGFTLKEYVSGDLNHGRHFICSLPYMSCIGKKSPFNETTNVPVMHCLSAEPAIPIDFELFFAKLEVALCIYLIEVSSRVMTRLFGILYSSTSDAVSRRYKIWSSFFTPSDIWVS